MARQLAKESEDTDESRVKEKREKEYAQIFKKDYIDIVNEAIGPDESPILDIIAWHIHRASYDVIRFNEE